MKKWALVVLFLLIGTFASDSNAQILKKISKKVEQKVEQRVNRKVDQGIDKALDKAEEEVEKPLKETPDKPLPKPNAAAKDSATKSLTTAPTTANLADGLILLPGDCSEFIWFKEGANMKFQAKDDKGKEMYVSEMKITKVYNESGLTVSEVDMSDDKKNSIAMKFKCSGDKLYMDLAGALKQELAKSNPNLAKESAQNIEMGFNDGFMSFPKNMYPGQQLDDAVFTMKMGSGGANMEVTTSLTDRKVVAKEAITTPAGTFNCVKVIGLRKSTMKLLGKDRNMGKPSEEHVWFAPGIGTIKQENYIEKGKLESMSHLIEFKM